MNYAGEFAANLAGAMFWPLIVISIFAVIVLIYGEVQKEDSQFGSGKHGLARFAQHVATQGTLLLWGIYIVASAVPAPDYIHKETVREVVKEVRISDDFATAYANCMKPMRQNGRDDEIDSGICDTMAKEMVLGKPETIVKTETVTEEVLAPREARYQALFNTCMGGDRAEGPWRIHEPEDGSATIAELRDRRIQLCHAQTKEVLVN